MTSTTPQESAPSPPANGDRQPSIAPEPAPAEWRALLALALPTLGGQIAQTANGFVDSVMAGAVSPLDLAAVSVGASLWVPVYLFIVGVVIAATPQLSRHIGAGRHDAVIPTAWQAIWLALSVGIAGFFVLRHATAIFPHLHVPPELRALTERYLDGLSWGIPGIALFIGLRCYTESLSHTRPVLWISFAGMLANIPLNYIFIHGLFGMPAMGGPGCGVATAIVMWMMAALMWRYVRRAKFYVSHAPAGTRFEGRIYAPDWREIFSLLRVGVPIGMAIFFEVSIFAAVAVLLSVFGVGIVAGHQIALNCASLTFMVPLSLALALTVRTGLAVGAGDLQAALRTARTGVVLAVCIAALNAVLLLAGRHFIPALYTQDAAVQWLASALIVYAAIFQLPDALQVAANGALRGFNDTAVPMWITLFAYWGIGLPLGYALGYGHVSGFVVTTPMGPQGFWIGLIAGLAAAALMLNLRLVARLRAT